MNNKELYLELMQTNDGKSDEITLGEKLDLTENETRAIISQLLSEHKITFNEFGICKYKPRHN